MKHHHHHHHLLPQEKGGNEPEEQQNPNKKNCHEREDYEDGDEGKPRCEWSLSLSAVVSSSSSASSVDVLGAIEFDPTDKIVATAGISRKIRFYCLDSLLPINCGDKEDREVAILDHAITCEYYITTPAKLSSLRWRPDSGGRVIGSGDYDGVVTEYDMEKRCPVFERDEHGGRRVWSVDYTYHVGASGSDDCTMQVWDPRCRPETCVGVVRPGTGSCPSQSCAVCSVEFDPFGGATVAVGCADRRAYVYDLRKLVDPALTLEGHTKTVSYVRFLDVGAIVTAGTDGCLKLWNTDAHEARVVRTYKGHVNSRNFVGLSVWRNGALFGCGSENNRVFVYDKRWGQPVWVHGFEPAGSSGSERRFVSSVCWRQSGVDQCTLVAGGSDGALQVYVGKRKP